MAPPTVAQADRRGLPAAARGRRRLGMARDSTDYAVATAAAAAEAAACQPRHGCNGGAGKQCHCPQWKECTVSSSTCCRRRKSGVPASDEPISASGKQRCHHMGGQALRHDDGSVWWVFAPTPSTCAWPGHADYLAVVWAAQMTESTVLGVDAEQHYVSPIPPQPLSCWPAIAQPEAHEPIVCRAGRVRDVVHQRGRGPGSRSPVVGGKPCSCSTPAGVRECGGRRTQALPDARVGQRSDSPWSTPRKMLSACAGAQRFEFCRAHRGGWFRVGSRS